MSAAPPTAAAADPHVTSAPPAAVALVETDSFCDCGYNLHGQKVWRDPHLELLVCRCPECGRHAAAGRFTGIHSTWLHRLSMGLILLWVLFLLALFAFLIPMLGAWPSIHMDRDITLQPLATQGPNATQYQYVLTTAEHGYRFRRSNEDIVIAVLFGTLNGLVLGGAVSVFLWHLRRHWRFAFALFPLAVMAVVYWGWVHLSFWPMSEPVQRHVFGTTAGYAALEAACVVVGILFGRVIARGVLRVLLPARLLQHLAFLWYRDGKEPPVQKGGVAA